MLCASYTEPAMLQWAAIIQSFLSSDKFRHWTKPASTCSASFSALCSLLLPPLLAFRASIIEPVLCGSSQLGTWQMQFIGFYWGFGVLYFDF
jgi:hypothetical protein